MAIDEILEVNRFAKVDGEWSVFCPHCKALVALADDDLPRGEQFTHRCGGTFEVTSTASLVSAKALLKGTPYEN